MNVYTSYTVVTVAVSVAQYGVRFSWTDTIFGTPVLKTIFYAKIALRHWCQTTDVFIPLGFGAGVEGYVMVDDLFSLVSR